MVFRAFCRSSGSLKLSGKPERWQERQGLASTGILPFRHSAVLMAKILLLCRSDDASKAGHAGALLDKPVALHRSRSNIACSVGTSRFRIESAAGHVVMLLADMLVHSSQGQC